LPSPAATSQAGASLRIVAYDPAHDQAVHIGSRLQADFRDALLFGRPDHARVPTPPSILLTWSRSARALWRWHHPGLGLLRPARLHGALDGTELSAALTGRVPRTGRWRSPPGVPSRPEELAISVKPVPAVHRRSVPARTPGRAAGPARLPAEQPSWRHRVVTGRGRARPAGEARFSRRRSADPRSTTSSPARRPLSFLTSFRGGAEVNIDRAFVSHGRLGGEPAAIRTGTIDLAHRLSSLVARGRGDGEQARNALLELGTDRKGVPAAAAAVGARPPRRCCGSWMRPNRCR